MLKFSGLYLLVGMVLWLNNIPKAKGIKHQDKESMVDYMQTDLNGRTDASTMLSALCSTTSTILMAAAGRRRR